MDWKLTDEEIAEISRDIVKQAKATGGGEFGLAECFGLDNQLHCAIADAAVRKVDTELLEPWERGLKEQLQMPTASMSLVPCIEADYRSKLMVILSLRQALK